ncbi:MAG: septum formation initiator family protein [Tetrasphaera sp.]
MPPPSRRPPTSRPRGRGDGDRAAARSLSRVTAPPESAGARSAWSVRRFMVVASVALLLLVLLGPTLKSYLSQRSQISALREQVSAQKADVASMEREKALWATDGYVEQQARERLRMVRPGEKAYTVLDPTQAAAEQLDGRAAGIGAGHPWYGQIWESAKLADNPQLASGK